MSKLQMERITENATLGEGPHWDVDTKSLYFVDIIRKTIHKYTPSSKTFTTASTGKQPSIIIPVDGCQNEFVITQDNTVEKIRWDSASETIIQHVQVLAEVDSDTNNKFNDGKCDSSGRLWAGTLELNLENLEATLPKGYLYSFECNYKARSHRDGIKIANGLAWNDATKKMYYIDSLTGRIDEYDFDLECGTIANCRPFFTLSKHNIPGFPDGMTIDCDGNLWVAIFDGSRVIKVATAQPEKLLDTIMMPAKQVTSVTFGGCNLDELFVTTACIPGRGYEVKAPEDGATYRILGLSVKGTRNVSFKLNS